MFHPFFFHSCRCHEALADAMMLAAALKLEQDIQDKWREDRKKEIEVEVAGQH